MAVADAEAGESAVAVAPPPPSPPPPSLEPSPTPVQPVEPEPEPAKRYVHAANNDSKAEPPKAGDSSGDDAACHDDSDGKTSTSSDSRPSVRATSFSLVAFPGKVRASIFARRLPALRRQLRKKKSRRGSVGLGVKSASLSPDRRPSSLPSLFRRPAPEPTDSVEKFKHFWDEKLRGTMDRITANRAVRPDGDVFHLLLKLYAHQDVIEELYSSYEANAAEFEFYIPQLCTFLLHGNYVKQHQLECFLMSRSGDSLTFAHRLTWFLRSFCDDAKQYQSEYLSVTASPDQENSDLLTAIELRAGVPALLMNNGLCVEEVSPSKPANLQRRRSIVFPIDQELDPTALVSDESFAGQLLTKRASVVYEARTEEGNSQQISLYKQTPDFVDALTGLADALIPVSRPERNQELAKGLRAIQDELLPSDVLYLPIGNSYHRVKAIHVEECFTFSTKERVPYFLCVEVLDYSVSVTSEHHRKRRLDRHQPRGFSLKLRFKKNANAHRLQHSDEECSCSNKSADGCSCSNSGYSDLEILENGAVLLTPKLPKIAEDQQLVGAVGFESPFSAVTAADNSHDEKDMLAPTKLATDGMCEPLDGEVGDDEKEGEIEKPKLTALVDESAAEADILRQSTDEQSERMGQWSQPRARRDSKTHSSSTSARSGGQFDTFYSSWFSRKTRREQAEAAAAGESDIVGAEQVNDVSTDCDSSTPTVSSAAKATSSDATEASTQPEEDLGTNGEGMRLSEATSRSHAEGGAFMSWLPWRKSGNAVPAVVIDSTAADGTSQIEDVAEVNNHVPNGSGDIVVQDALPAEPTTSGPTEPLPETLQGGAIVSTDEQHIDTSDETEINETSAESAKHAETTGVFGWLFRKPKASDPSEESRSLDVDVQHDDNNANIEADITTAPEHCEPSELVSGSSKPIDIAVAPANSDCGADSTDITSTSTIAAELTKSPSQDHTKPFTFWFARKPKPQAHEGIADSSPETVELATNDEVATDDAAEVRGVDTAVDTEGDAAESSRGERELSRKRSRDLSLSIDFTDAEAWKEKFDLEDGLSDPELDEDEEVEDGAESDNNDCEPEIPEDLVVVEEDEKPMIVFRERWSEKEARIRQESPFGDHPGWRLLSVIVKSNDDLRQEQFAAQLIAQCDHIFREYSLPLTLRPYNVIATSATTGLIEAVPDTVSLDSLKRNDPEYTTLLDFFYRLHGPKDSVAFTRARRNFVESLAAYSIVCYVFQIKDRHNGNILLDTDGHVVHIDFGFLLTNSPGSNLNFERAPFKLTDEFVELMGGPRSSTFRYFRSLCIRAYLALRRNMDKIVLLVEMMLVGNADLPCFAGGKRAVIEGLRSRLKPGARTSTCQLFVNQLIDQSINNWRTRWYDKYQRACLGIM